MALEKKYAIIPAQLPIKQLFDIVKKVAKDADMNINVHNYYDMPFRGEDKDFPTNWQGAIYLSDISSDSYATDNMSRIITLYSFDKPNHASIVDHIYSGPRIILEMGDDDLSNNLLGEIISATGGYDIYDVKKGDFDRIVPTEILSSKARIIEAEIHIKGEIEKILKNNGFLFKTNDLENISEEVMEVISSHINLPEPQIVKNNSIPTI